MKKKKKDFDKKIEYIEEAENEEKEIDFARKIKKLKEELKKCQQEKNEYLQGWQRERADFVNYRNQEEKRKKELMFFAKEKLIVELLGILDNFERAEKEMPKEFKKNSWAEGMIGIKKQIKDILRKEGVEEIKDNSFFNPEIHEAVEIGNGEDEKILEVLQKGYFLEGQVLRPTRVKVAKSNH